jgi:hypothetical protein
MFPLNTISLLCVKNNISLVALIPLNPDKSEPCVVTATAAV